MKNDSEDRNVKERLGASASPESFPCTTIQRRFFHFQEQNPASSVLNVAMRWRLFGPVRDIVVERALQGLLDRHEILRTVFVERGGEPRQVIETARIKLSVIDVSRLAPDLRADEITRISTLEARRPFDLALAPLIRASLVRLSAGEAILLLTFHHAVCDGWSVGVLARELVALIAAQLDRNGQGLAELDLQYADYALWQKEMLASPEADRQRRFWRTELDGVPFFEVPHLGRPRPSRHSGEGAIRSLLLPRDETDRLQAFARQEGLTLFTAAGACLAAMLAREGQVDELVLSTQVALRDDQLLQSLVGPVSSTVPLRLDVSMVDRDRLSYLRQCRAKVADAFSNKELPLEEIISAARLSEVPGHPFVFGVNYTLQAANIDTGRSDAIRMGDVELVSMPSVSVGSLYDLSFFMVDRASEGWRISCEFNADLYDASDTDRLLANWRTEMGRFVAVPAEVEGRREGPAAPKSASVRVANRTYFQTVALQPKGARPPIFAFNNRSVYYPIARHLGTARPFVDIQWGERATVPPLDGESIPEIAADAARCVRAFDPRGPYYLMGHCMVGNVAFETAQQLRATGSEVLGIFLLDTVAPGYVESMPVYDKILRRFQLADHSIHYLFVLLEKIRSGELSISAALSHYRFIRNNTLTKFAQKVGILSRFDEPGADLMNHGLMNYLRDAKALYNVEPYHGDVVFFRSAEARIGRLFGRSFGWDKIVRGDLRVYDVPGAHLKMTQEPGASVIAEHMAWFLDRKEGRWRMPDLGS